MVSVITVPDREEKKKPVQRSRRCRMRGWVDSEPTTPPVSEQPPPRLLTPNQTHPPRNTRQSIRASGFRRPLAPPPLGERRWKGTRRRIGRRGAIGMPLAVSFTHR